MTSLGFLKVGTLSLMAAAADNRSMKVEASPMYVLIIADDPLLQRVASWILREEGMDVDVVESPEVAVDSISQRPPDLIIMNTEKSLAEKAEAIRQYRSITSSVPILDLAKEWRDESGIGADVYLAKPFDGDQLLEKVAEAVNGAYRHGG